MGQTYTKEELEGLYKARAALYCMGCGWKWPVERREETCPKCGCGDTKVFKDHDKTINAYG
jgi:Zn finger protein HypA/HybF involved in hydrogenase expression